MGDRAEMDEVSDPRILQLVAQPGLAANHSSAMGPVSDSSPQGRRKWQETSYWSQNLDRGAREVHHYGKNFTVTYQLVTDLKHSFSRSGILLS